MHARFYQEAKQAKTCYHPKKPDECCGTFAKAHTVQKQTGLNLIAEEGHVLSARNLKPNNRNEALERIGIQVASTFQGFCAKHDNELFQPAETASVPSAEVAFLLTYRALCYEIHTKQTAIRTFEFIRDNIDKGLPFISQSNAQESIAASLFSTRLGFNEHLAIKRSWDAALLSKDYSNFRWCYARFDGIIPAATSGVFFPEVDFKGDRLQPLDAPIGTLAMMGFNVLPIGGKSSILFGWLDGKDQNKRFVESFLKLPDSILASAVIQFCFDTSDNLFVRPSWWLSLRSDAKKYLTNNLRNSVPGEKWLDGLVPRLPSLLKLAIIERTKITGP
ncbi:hypothetical protein [Pontixanthobacter sp.]|uniref:hypothetical protein n=1 Tax=Pontixanthobacter sp. TaxID=2792078 RepID=UPI003C7D2986